MQIIFHQVLLSAQGGLGRNLLVGKLRDISSLAGVLNGNPADIAASVQVENRVLIKIFGLSDIDNTELNV